MLNASLCFVTHDNLVSFVIIIVIFNLDTEELNTWHGEVSKLPLYQEWGQSLNEKVILLGEYEKEAQF